MSKRAPIWPWLGLGLGVLGLGGALAVAVVAASAGAGTGGGAGPVADSIAARYQITPELAAGIVRTAHRVGTQPIWLAGLIDLETNSKFSPGRHYPGHPTFSATGLIGFTSETAEWLGTTTNHLASLTAIEQLEFVALYLNRTKRGEHYDDPGVVPLDSLQRLAWSVFWPVARNWSPDRTVPAWVTKANPKVLFVRDYTNAVRARVLG